MISSNFKVYLITCDYHSTFFVGVFVIKKDDREVVGPSKRSPSLTSNKGCSKDL